MFLKIGIILKESRILNTVYVSYRYIHNYLNLLGSKA